MVKALLVSMIAIYLILMFQFRSVIDPLVVMAAIPLGLLGASLGLLVTGNPFGFTAFLGIVSLGGVVVRNAIILVDYIRARMAEGVAIEEAAVEAGERRLRPIFLTTMAAAVGVTPMILSGSSMWSPLGNTIAFGLVGSMFFTLIVIPVLYVMVHKHGSRPSPSSVQSPMAAAALLAIICCVAAHAQTRTLTLDEAVSLATQQNSSVKIAGQKVNQMDARIREARASYFPSLVNDSNAVHISNQQRIEIPQGALGVYPQTGPLPGSTVSLAQGNSNFFLSTTTLSQPITHYFRTHAQVNAARADAASARADARRTANEIAFKVKELFYAILTTERRRDAIDSQIRAVELRTVETRNAVDTGVALEMKAVEVRAQIAQAQHARGQLQDAVADMKLELADLTGLPLDTDFDLAAPDTSASDSAPTVTGTAQVALARNPEIEAAGHQIEKARAGVIAARAEYIPEVGAFAQYIHENGAPFVSPNTGVVGLNLKWTVFELGKRRGQVSERRAEVAQAEENLAQVRRRVQVDAEKAVRKLKRAETALDSARQLLASATEARRVTSDHVEAGTANQSALLDSEAAISGAQADVLRAEYDRSVAAADLARVTGSL
jgi:outer membrane protein TolC